VKMQHYIANLLRRTGLILVLVSVVTSNTSIASDFDLQEFRGKVVVLGLLVRSVSSFVSMDEQHAGKVRR